MEESFFIWICLALLYSYTNAIRERYNVGYNVEGISTFSRNRISTLVAVGVCWIETLGELWSCTVGSVGVFSVLREDEKVIAQMLVTP